MIYPREVKQSGKKTSCSVVGTAGESEMLVVESDKWQLCPYGLVVSERIVAQG